MPRSIDEIIVHCSASPDGKPFRAADIDRWHQERGFSRIKSARMAHNPSLGSIGYHYIIDIDGTLESGRSEQEVGAHCVGHNSRSIGVCLIGTRRFTLSQWRVLVNLLGALRGTYPRATVHGHREFADKECPGFDVQAWLQAGEPIAPAAHHFFENTG